MITIKKAREQDLETVRSLAYKIWPDTYREFLSDHQIDYMLDKMYNKGELLSQLQKGYIFLIAEDENQEIGFAGYSVSDSENHIYKLHKLYILPSVQGKGIGKLLINEVADHAKRAGAQFLQLNVNRNNKAKEFYEKAGFYIKETVDLDIGNGFFMNDYVMEKTL